MPSVYLQGRCTRPEDLPDVCMKCGAETTHRVTRTFNWVPPWIGVTFLAGALVYFILAMALRKTYTVAVPLCEDHKGHWTNRLLLIIGSLVLLVGGSIGLAVLVGNLTGPGNDDVVPFLIFLVIGCILAWLVILIAANATQIRPEEITDRGIRLTGVCMQFADAYRDVEDRERSARREALDHWDDRRDRRRDEDDRPRRRRDDRYEGRRDEEDDRPRRRRDPEDDY